VANSCQVCHREETQNLVNDVYERQQKFKSNLFVLEEQLVRAHVEAKKAWDLGASEEQMQPILIDIRHAQWRWDYAAASHGGSFHSPVESARVVGTAITAAQEGRIKLARLLGTLGWDQPVPYPDIDTKEKAQAYVTLDIEAMEKEKEEFKKNIIPQWLEAAQQREQATPIETVSLNQQ
jgi:nitrite reductase (cytochrome c-552)